MTLTLTSVDSGVFISPDRLPVINDSKDDGLVEEILAVMAEPIGVEGMVQLSPDESKRFEALNQAVEARQADETPGDTVERAEAFYKFLTSGLSNSGE